MRKKGSAKTLTPMEVRQLFDQILALHLDRLIGTSHGIDGLPLNLVTITVMILVTEQATDEIENFSSAAPRFSSRTLVREMKEIGIVAEEGVESVFQEMVQIGYLHEDDQGLFSAKKPTISMTRLLDKVFPKIPGMNLVAYFVQMIEETTSNRKDRNEALAQFDQTLLLHGVDLRSGPADGAGSDQTDQEEDEPASSPTVSPPKVSQLRAKSASGTILRQTFRKSALKRPSTLSPRRPSSLISGKPVIQPREIKPAVPKVKQVAFGAGPDGPQKIELTADQEILEATGEPQADEPGGPETSPTNNETVTGESQSRVDRESIPMGDEVEGGGIGRQKQSIDNVSNLKPEAEMVENSILAPDIKTPSNAEWQQGEESDPDSGQDAHKIATTPVAETELPAESGLSAAEAPPVQSHLESGAKDDAPASELSALPSPKPVTDSSVGPVVGDPPAGEPEAVGENVDELIQRRIAEFEQKLAMQCPLCREGKIIAKETAKSKVYYQCLNTRCNLISWGKPYHLECPRCKNPFLVEIVDAKQRTSLKCPRATCRHRQGLPATTAGTPSQTGTLVSKASSVSKTTPARKPRRKVVKRRVVRKKR